MPLEPSGLSDPLTQITELRTSTLIEMFAGLQVLSHRWRKNEWKNQATEALGQAFMEKLFSFIEQYGTLDTFIEISFAYPDSHDVTGFIDWIDTLPLKTLVFYKLGRLYPLSLIPEPITRTAIDEMIKQYRTNPCFDSLYDSTLWAEDIETMQKNLSSILKEYWEKFFSKEYKSYQKHWDTSNQELEALLIRSGGTAVYSKFSKTTELPPEVPEGTPYTSIHYIPVCHPSRSPIKFFGYGNITVVYDCTLNADYEKSIEEIRKNILLISKALGDERRLQIVKLIAGKEFGLNGKTLAEKMRLSPSVISRHLSQLKEANLLTEKSEDNRNITYRLNWKIMEDYSSLLMKFLGNT